VLVGVRDQIALDSVLLLDLLCVVVIAVIGGSCRRPEPGRGRAQQDGGTPDLHRHDRRRERPLVEAVLEQARRLFAMTSVSLVSDEGPPMAPSSQAAGPLTLKPRHSAGRLRVRRRDHRRGAAVPAPLELLLHDVAQHRAPRELARATS
jgi:hypothetical protein